MGKEAEPAAAAILTGLDSKVRGDRSRLKGLVSLTGEALVSMVANPDEMETQVLGTGLEEFQDPETRRQAVKEPCIKSRSIHVHIPSTSSNCGSLGSTSFVCKSSCHRCDV